MGALNDAFDELIHYGHGLTAEMIAEMAHGAENIDQLLVRLAERCEYERTLEDG
jgi:hypothetical protein